MNAVARLEAGAARRGLRLRWLTEPDKLHPRMAFTSVDLMDGKKVLNPLLVCVMHSARAEARERVAQKMLGAIARGDVQLGETI